MPSEGLLHRLEEAEALLADGFDDALIGQDRETGRAVYSTHKMIDILVERDDMSYDDAVEYLEFNTFCAYVGEMTPLYIDLDEDWS